jgi:hypothetical protein
MTTLLTTGKEGIYMEDAVYDKLSAFVLESLDEQENLTLGDLITLARMAMGNKIASLEYKLLHVKQDLLARKIIRQVPALGGRGMPVISVRNKKMFNESIQTSRTVL